MATLSSYNTYQRSGTFIDLQANIKNNLHAFWTMDEAASATRVDSHNGLDIVDNGGSGVGQSIGTYIGTAADFLNTTSDAGTASNLYNSTYPDLRNGENSFSCFCWIEPDTLDTGSFLLARSDNSSNTTDGWALKITSTDYPAMEVVSGDTGYTATWSSVVDTSNAFFVVGVYDYPNDTVKISVNGGDFITAAVTGKADNDGDFFQVGRRGFTTNKMYYMGLMNRAGVSSCALTIEEIRWLYNSGVGRSYSEITA